MSGTLIIVVLFVAFFAGAHAVSEWLARRGGPPNGDDSSAMG